MSVPVRPRGIRTTRAPLGASARALLQLSWARTMTPMLVLSMCGLIALPMLFAVEFASRSAANADAVSFLVLRYDQLIFAFATPLIALLLGTSAFSAEAEDGTLMYLVTTTTPRWWISAVRVLFAAVLTAVLSALAVLGTGWIATGVDDPMHVTSAFALAAAFGGATYAALFTVLSLITRRALVLGLGYVLFWEGILSATIPGIRYLSVREWMLAVAAELTDASNARLSGGPSVTVCLVGAALVFVLAVLVGGARLNRPRISRIGT